MSEIRFASVSMLDWRVDEPGEVPAERPHNPYGPPRDLIRPYVMRRLKTDKSVIAGLPVTRKKPCAGKVLEAADISAILGLYLDAAPACILAKSASCKPAKKPLAAKPRRKRKSWEAQHVERSEATEGTLPYVMFHTFFPEVAERETRTVTVLSATE